MKILLRILIALGVAVVVMQFIGRPEKTNPPEVPSLTLANQIAVPAAVRDILERSCADCHSNRTRWPWYSSVAPVSWLVASDVEEGREHLNFSVWGTYSRKRQASRLLDISREVDKGEMPMGIYVLMHGNARLSTADKDTLCTWAENLSDELVETSE